MTEIPPPPDDKDISMQHAADAARGLIGEGSGPDIIGFRPHFTSPEEQATFMGEGLYNDARAMMRRYPVSHAPNVTEVINGVRTDKEPASTKDLRAGNIELTTEEIIRLGERRNSNPTLSVARIPKSKLTRLAEHEPSRRKLARWLSSPTDSLLDSIDTIEFHLFNDTTELVVGEGRTEETGQPPARWVMRFRSYTDEAFTKLQERLRMLEGLIPKTHLIREGGGQRTLALSEWIPGQYATTDQRDQFEAALRDKGINPDRLDTHEENIIRRPSGQLVYVDGDYLEA